MAGGGFYNEHSAPQHDAGSFGLAAWRAAAASVPLPSAGTPFLIADCGAAQGRNSLAPMRAAIASGLNDGLRDLIEADPARASCHWRLFTMTIAKPA
jgi:hypothetical protein